MERYLEGGTIDTKEIVAALSEAVAAGITVPVLCGSATKGIGVDLLADFIVDEVPSPLERLPVKATKGGEESVHRCRWSPGGARVQDAVDPYVGKLTFFRVYSGTFRPDQTVFNASRDAEERVGQVHTLRGKHQETVWEVPAGDIGALAKLSRTITGDTLDIACDPPGSAGCRVPGAFARRRHRAENQRRRGQAVDRVAQARRRRPDVPTRAELPNPPDADHGDGRSAPRHHRSPAGAPPRRGDHAPAQGRYP